MMCLRYHTDEPTRLLPSEEGEEEVEPDDLIWPKHEPLPGSDPPNVIKEHRFASLKPSSLSIADYVDLCDSVCHLRFISSDRPLRVGYNTFGSTPLPFTSFPSLTTQGFFYCRTYPDHPLASEIRFRLTPRPSPVSFHSGCDLLKSNRLPWNIPLLAMFKDYRAFEPLVQFMSSEKILPERFSLQEVDAFGYSQFAAIKEHASVVLRSFGEPFYYSFKHQSPSLLWIVGRNRMRPLHTRDLFDLPYIARTHGHASLPLEGLTDVELKTMVPRAGSGLFSLEPSADDGIAIRCLKHWQAAKTSFWATMDASRPPSAPRLTIRAGELLQISGRPVLYGLSSSRSTGAIELLYRNTTFNDM